ncbi:P-loop containing nucleoside triphosphate hydrolase protein [Aulographum hederae CBS 113979]|uniref:P-loop containing nucleoside triphosphate hydrolase protein n=1 Tax=Aulographum hederae CBS 113979 TaxID=1176131 RepID=A0A6G1H3H0_9PEZI|nr:P-loop containing nucleoside triphosphate hydrolase protein [Aulographum hederae CBS 113979]
MGRHLRSVCSRRAPSCATSSNRPCMPFLTIQHDPQSRSPLSTRSLSSSPQCASTNDRIRTTDQLDRNERPSIRRPIALGRERREFMKELGEGRNEGSNKRRPIASGREQGEFIKEREEGRNERSLSHRPVALFRERREFFKEREELLEARNKVYNMPIHPKALYKMESALEELRAMRKGTDTHQTADESKAGVEEPARRLPYLEPLDPEAARSRSALLRANLHHYESNPAFERIRDARSELPINHYKEQLLEMINNNDFSIVLGATGSGKTTQLAQIIFDDAIKRGDGAACNIFCLLPRRVAVISVARRVAEERGEAMASSVGYQVRFDQNVPQFPGKILFQTDGLALAMMSGAPHEFLDGVSHLIIDEAHERPKNQDALLLLLKHYRLVRKRAGKPMPKVVLMSATLNTELFSTYLGTKDSRGKLLPCPVLEVPGRTYPITTFYLDDVLGQLQIKTPRKDKGLNEIPIDLIVATIVHLSRKTHDGAILVFVPGLTAIEQVLEKLRLNPSGVLFSNPDQYRLIALHSSLSEGQLKVFEPVHGGCRKIVIATNIAEASITIPDVKYGSF